jgi:surface antigen
MAPSNEERPMTYSFSTPPARHCGQAIAVLLLAAFSAAAIGSDLSFLQRSAAAHFTKADLAMLQSAAMDLLKNGKAGDTRDWSNPDTSAKGSVTVTKVFQSTEGFSCKTLRVDNSAAGYHGQATHPVCEVKPGDWKIHSSAKPATQP